MGFMKSSLACAVLLAAVLSGCQSYAPEELERLTKEDPAFRQMITARDQMRAEIRTIKRDLLAKKQGVDAEVAKLRAVYDGYSKMQNVKIEALQQRMEAYRNLLRREMETQSAQLAAKVTELEGYKKTLQDVRNVLRESKGIKISATEKQKWEERVLILTEKIRPLTDEIEQLKAQIQLKKTKIAFLR